MWLSFFCVGVAVVARCVCCVVGDVDDGGVVAGVAITAMPTTTVTTTTTTHTPST